ncbi:MAG: ATP phosphoribosyltransferase regulatory subunit, partial [Alphaproteobacteria bacterium]|nr:ATP phosphoribosyltransferase regulatory subunit [Alphaproteobacteria bacterium]
MAGKSKAEREALERQNAAIMAVFERAGFDHIAPDIIQPADIFLERSGEDIRARTFVFTDPAGNEMCLRPDLTVPACRYHLSHASDPAAEQRYCYLGPAFRFPDERLSPQEFTQAGVEWFGAGDSIAAEARVLKLTLSALEVAGATGLKVTLGDLGLFSCLLDDMEMPDRWRRRLKHHFWRPSAFHDLLNDF